LSLTYLLIPFGVAFVFLFIRQANRKPIGLRTGFQALSPRLHTFPSRNPV
jgi:hypothetical protein